MTRVVFAPDSFKGTVSALAASRALAEGWAAEDPSLVPILKPMADGGEGTLDAFATAVSGSRRMPVRVRHPAEAGGRAVDASWLLLPPDPASPRGTAVVELASTAGIELLGDGLAPWHAGTYGFGQAIAAALDHGVSRLVLALGSSASTDGGVGMLQALGARFSGVSDRVSVGAAGLTSITEVDLRSLRSLPPSGVTVLTDVTAPLLGPRGASAQFGIQKGFRPSELAAVDDALAHLSSLLPIDPSTPGAGAAGGTGFALLAWGGELRTGASVVSHMIGLPEAIADADCVVTGEGAYDAQSLSGKVPGHVLTLTRTAHVPAAVVAGRIAHDARADGFSSAVSLTELAGGSERALRDPISWLRRAGALLASQNRQARVAR